MRGLLIREPWIGKILAGSKTWEMRSTPTNIRGEIALIRQGSGMVVGTARLVDSLPPLTRNNYMDFTQKHAIPREMLDEVMANDWVYPWVFEEPRPIARSVPYGHKSGVVTFQHLDAPVVEAIRQQRLNTQEQSLPGSAERALPQVSPASQAPPGHREKAKPAPTPSTSSSISGATPSRAGGPVFVFRPEKAQAYGYPEHDGRFVVLKGSTAMRKGSPTKKRDELLRDDLVKRGILVPDTDHELHRFSVDFPFSSASTAAGVIKDGNASGPSLWKDETTGRSLRDHLAGSNS